VFARRDEARAKAFRGLFRFASRSDLFLTYVIINPQADRSKDWGDQDGDLVARVVDEDTTGITIRGAKMLGTSSIMANEVFVANLQPLKAGEEDLAFCLRAADGQQGPARALAQVVRGKRGLGLRQSAVLALRRERRHHLFDDVKVDWDRAVRASATSTSAAPVFTTRPATSIRTYQSQIRLVVKLKFLSGWRAGSPRRSAPPTCRRCASS